MTEQYQQPSINLASTNSPRIADLSVNAARLVGGYDGGAAVLSAGTATNPAGAFNGGGTGNKAILGAFGFNGLPISKLESISFVWENEDGPGGPNFIPPGATTSVTPNINLIIDFDPNGSGDIRVCPTLTDQLDAAISGSTGTFVNDGNNVLTYSWDGASDNVLIVLAPPNPVPGGVAPNVTTGASWFQNSYKWTELVAANPTAILVDAFSADGGLPAGAVTPSVLLTSGDSGNTTRSGKRIKSFIVNGQDLLSK